MNKPLLLGINSKYIHPSMGIYYLVSNCKFQIDFLEFSIKDDIEDMYQKIIAYNPTLIGFSTYIWNIEIVKKLILKLTDYNIFLGGPEASYDLSLFQTFNNVKYIIKGEGEDSLNELLEYYNKDLSLVSNLYYKIGSQIKYTYNAFPDLKRVKIDLSLIKDFQNRVVYLESSRGCPFKCSYCLASLDNALRPYPIDVVYQNILYVLEKKAKIVKFLDRSFSALHDFANQILEFIIEHDNNYTTFQIELNLDYVKESTINILKKARFGLIRLEVGIQSTNTFTNKAIDRNQDFDKLKKVFNELKTNCIIHADIIAGLPYENYDSFINTFNTTHSLFPHEFQLGILKELKGTKISNEKDLHGFEFNKTPPYEIIKNNYLSKLELDKIKIAEKGLDLLYNSNNYPKTIVYLFKQLNLNPYEVYYQIGLNFKNQKNTQLSEVFIIIYNSLVVFNNLIDQEYLLFIMKQDYLKRNKIRPKIVWTQIITKAERKNVFELLIQKHPLNLDILYRYAHIEKYQEQYYIINYKTHTEYFL